MGSGARQIPSKQIISSEIETNMSTRYLTSREQPERRNSEELKGSTDTYDTNSLSNEDMCALENAAGPIPLNEGKRLKILRQSNLLDSTIFDPEFDRFTSLAHHIFEVCFCLPTSHIYSSSNSNCWISLLLLSL